MSSIVVFPIKSHSERVPEKNFLRVGGKKLYQIMPHKARISGRFDRVVIDTDSLEIKRWALSVGIEVIERVPYLAKDTANGNDLLRSHVRRFPDYDYYWQGFVTAPFISIKTIENLVEKLSSLDKFDSILTVKPIRGFFWSNQGLPITYRTDVLPRGQELPFIYSEISGFFGISREGFAKTQSRVGVTPYLYPLLDEESLDIDWKSDVSALKNSPQS